MRLTAFLIIFSLFSRAQFPVICSPKEALLPSNSLLQPKNICEGPGKQKYSALITKSGLVFQKTLDSAGSHYSREIIVMPLKNELNFKLNGMPSIAFDASAGEFKGRIYICWSDKKNGDKNEDVFLVYSDDIGLSWTEPILVTYYPNHKMQFDPALKINSKSGAVNIVYYDRQNFLMPGYSDVYLAVSENGGLKFEYYKINREAINISGNDLALAEIETKKYTNEIAVIWNEKKKNKKMYKCMSIVNDSTITKYKEEAKTGVPEMQKTFLFGDEIKISFKSRSELLLSAAITRPLEPGFEKIIVKNRKYGTGENVLLVKTKDLGLNKGTYVLTLYFNNKNIYTWITEE